MPQATWATIINCADRHVPPELTFAPHGTRESFVARNLSTLLDTAMLGPVEYGIGEFRLPFIVVLPSPLAAPSRCPAISPRKMRPIPAPSLR